METCDEPVLELGLNVVALAAIVVFVILHRRRSRMAEIVTVSVFVLGFSCSFITKWKGTWQGSWDALLTTLQFIVLNVSANDSPGVALGIARIALPLATVGLFLSGLLRRGEQWVLRLRFVRAPDVVILGSGKAGLRLASALRSASPTLRLVAVDRDIESSGALEFQRRGFPVLDASIEAREVLDTLPFRRVDRVIICTEKATLDLSTARQVAVRLDAQAEHKPSIILDIDAPALARACRVDPVLCSLYNSGRLQFLNSTEFDARLLLQRFPPHRLIKRSFGPDSTRACHVAVQGTGALVDELIAYAARALVYPVHRLRVSVFVTDAETHRRRCFERFPVLDPDRRRSADPAYGGQTPVADVTFIESTANQLDVCRTRELHAQWPIDVLYVVGEDNLKVSLATLEVLKVVNTLDQRPAIVSVFDPEELTAGAGEREASSHQSQLSRRAELQELLARYKHQAELHFFWRYQWNLRDAGTKSSQPHAPHSGRLDGATPELPDAFGDEIAMRVWHTYEQKHQRSPRTQDDWAYVSHHEKSRNRYSGDHAALKLDLLTQAHGSQWDAAAILANGEMPEWLLELEHKRYVCERMIDGWLRISGEKFNDLHLNPTLVDYAQLQPDEREKDADAVRAQLAAALESRRAPAANAK